MFGLDPDIVCRNGTMALEKGLHGWIEIERSYDEAQRLTGLRFRLIVAVTSTQNHPWYNITNDLNFFLCGLWVVACVRKEVQSSRH